MLEKVRIGDFAGNLLGLGDIVLYSAGTGHFN